MPFTMPSTAVTGAVVEAAHRNILRDNDNWFNGLLGTPGAANYVPRLSNASAGSWGLLTEANFANGAFTTAKVEDGAVGTTEIEDACIAVAHLSTAAAQSLVPAGVVMMWPSTSIPTGWTRETDLNGRMPIAAGTTHSVTWAEDSDYGTSWAHNHAVSGPTGAPTLTTPNLDLSGTGVYRASTGHTHTISGNTEDATWLPPSRGIVYIRKDA